MLGNHCNNLYSPSERCTVSIRMLRAQNSTQKKTFKPSICCIYLTTLQQTHTPTHAPVCFVSCITPINILQNTIHGPHFGKLNLAHQQLAEGRESYDLEAFTIWGRYLALKNVNLKKDEYGRITLRSLEECFLTFSTCWFMQERIGIVWFVVKRLQGSWVLPPQVSQGSVDLHFCNLCH